MKKVLTLLLLTIPSLCLALVIDPEGGKRQPILNLEIALDNLSEVKIALNNLQSSVKPSGIQSVIFSGDLDGDGANEEIIIPAFLSKKGYDYYQAKSDMSVTKTSCCQEAVDGDSSTKSRVLGDSSSLGLESDSGELSLVNTSITIVSRRPGRAKYGNIVMRIVNPPEGLFETARKGWDGKVKGSIHIVTDDGQRISFPVIGILSGVELSLKEFSPAQDQLKSNPRH